MPPHHTSWFCPTPPQTAQALAPPDMLEALTGKGGRLLVSPWVPQLAVLAHPATKLFVTHAGLNSMHEALAAGKPMLAMPYSADQPGERHNHQRARMRALSCCSLPACGATRGATPLVAGVHHAHLPHPTLQTAQ